MAVAEALSQARTILLYGVSGVLDAYTEFQSATADWHGLGGPRKILDVE